MFPLKMQKVQQVLGTGLVRRSIAVVVRRAARRAARKVVCRVVVAAQCHNSPHSRILFLGCTEQEEVAVRRGILSRERTRRAS
jgi:hypothetical protein